MKNKRKAMAGTRYSVGGVPSWPRLGLPRNCVLRRKLARYSSSHCGVVTRVLSGPIVIVLRRPSRAALCRLLALMYPDWGALAAHSGLSPATLRAVVTRAERSPRSR